MTPFLVVMGSDNVHGVSGASEPDVAVEVDGCFFVSDEGPDGGEFHLSGWHCLFRFLGFS